MLYSCFVPHPPLIVPGVGTGDEIPDTRRAYEQVAAELNQQQPETVIIISPHSILYSDYFHIAPGTGAAGNFGAYGARNIHFSVAYDKELANAIGKLAQKQGIPAGPLGAEQPTLDHGVMVPLYFFKSKRIVRISLSGLALADHYRFGMCIREAVESLSRNVAIVASGDMSHKLVAEGPYGFAPEGPKHDSFVCDCIKHGDFRKLMSIDPQLSERAAECGLRSLVMLLGALDGRQTTSNVLSYEGPYGVGYMVASFQETGPAKSLLPQILKDKQIRFNAQRDNEDSYVKLARQNIERYVKTGQYIKLPKEIPTELLTQRAGVFVSIKKDGQLRGCIGTIAPTQKNIATEILKNSISAACHDPRFAPITPDELDHLTYSVDVLSPAEAIDDPSALDVLRYGVIVSNGHRRGLLLPNLEGIDSVAQQIDIARQKAGIGPEEPYTLERFEVVRHT